MGMFARLDRHGTITLPAELWEGLATDSVLEVVRRDDGVIELRPQLIDPDQGWFWSERWQQMEREADADIAAGQVQQFDDVESFLAHLDAESDAEPDPGRGA